MNKVLKQIRRHFVTGLITLLPLAITIYFVFWLIEKVDDMISVLIPESIFPGAGFLTVLLFVTIFGFFATNIFGRLVIRKWENIIAKLPIVRIIYRAVKQLLDSIVVGEENKLGTPILIKFPNPEIYSIGFITKKESEFALGATKGKEYVTAYIPTAPNPTTGFVVMVKRNQVKELDMEGNAALQGIISMGFSFQDSKRLDKIARATRKSGG